MGDNDNPKKSRYHGGPVTLESTGGRFKVAIVEVDGLLYEVNWKKRVSRRRIDDRGRRSLEVVTDPDIELLALERVAAFLKAESTAGTP